MDSAGYGCGTVGCDGTFAVPKPRKKRWLCLVKAHPLAERYLTTLLRDGRRPGVLVSGAGLSIDKSIVGEAPLMIVDADALPFTLQVFLRTAKMQFPDALAQVSVAVLALAPRKGWTLARGFLRLRGLCSRGVTACVAGVVGG